MSVGPRRRSYSVPRAPAGRIAKRGARGGSLAVRGAYRSTGGVRGFRAGKVGAGRAGTRGKVAARGVRGSRGAGARGRGRGVKKVAPTKEALDTEMDTFMSER